MTTLQIVLSVMIALAIPCAIYATWVRVLLRRKITTFQYQLHAFGERITEVKHVQIEQSNGIKKLNSSLANHEETVTNVIEHIKEHLKEHDKDVLILDSDVSQAKQQCVEKLNKFEERICKLEEHYQPTDADVLEEIRALREQLATIKANVHGVIEDLREQMDDLDKIQSKWKHVLQHIVIEEEGS